MPTPIQCCEKNVDTPYCPMCGKPSPAQPIYELFNHVKKQATIHKETLAKREKLRERERNATAKLDEPYIEKQRAKAKKWARWETALRELIEDSCPAHRREVRVW